MQLNTLREARLRVGTGAQLHCKQQQHGPEEGEELAVPSPPAM